MYMSCITERTPKPFYPHPKGMPACLCSSGNEGEYFDVGEHGALDLHIWCLGPPHMVLGKRHLSTKVPLYMFVNCGLGYTGCNVGGCVPCGRVVWCPISLQYK